MLYIVATPIGNLKDITIRAIETLKKVDLIVCEDTRETLKILKNYGFEKPLLSYYREIERKRVRKIVNMLMEGKEIALVCDRGTPGISDPAYLLVNEAYKHGIKVVPVPGPSALTAALSISGLPTDKFSFYGFLPRKKGKRKKLLESLKEREETLVFFESVHRIKDFLSEIYEIFGDREVMVCRELTKKFEEIKRGKIKEIIEWYDKNVVKGEFVILVKGKG
ncbi:MAG TPA: 16S rRNA (cytidine(1402)-2'-O)-methyltransferase [bacterium]|nr:16S rRNA (cytidine(1402)-2'-O)-methyltransferase [bacterium]